MLYKPMHALPGGNIRRYLRVRIMGEQQRNETGSKL